MTKYLEKINKYISNLLRSPRKILICVILIGTMIHVVSPNSIINQFQISFSSLFSGLLALIGFVFAARTFIIFKLYETVYRRNSYKKKINDLKREGAYKKDIMDPLRALDNSLSYTIALSLISLFLLIAISLLDPPRPEHTENLVKLIASITANGKIQYDLLLTKTFFPVIYKISSDIVCASILVTFTQLCYNLRSLNKNIKSIIDTWQKEADEAQQDT